MNKRIQIREFRFPEDYLPVFELWSNAGEGIHLHRSDEIIEIRKKLNRDPDLFLVAESQGELIGAVLGAFDGRRGMVYHLAVAEDYRRRGIGKMLMQALERILKSKGCIRCYLLIAYGNQEALQFYESSGWSKLDLNIYGKDIV